jgi:hypothetical protein
MDSPFVKRQYNPDACNQYKKHATRGLKGGWHNEHQDKKGLDKEKPKFSWKPLAHHFTQHANHLRLGSI